MSSPLRGLVVDDQQIVREGLATILDLLPDVTVVGTAANGSEPRANPNYSPQRHKEHKEVQTSQEVLPWSLSSLSG